eukprot:COSAG05_NODE_2696_length_2760_cov_63.496430_3_plen_168_part_00
MYPSSLPVAAARTAGGVTAEVYVIRIIGRGRDEKLGNPCTVDGPQAQVCHVVATQGRQRTLCHRRASRKATAPFGMHRRAGGLESRLRSTASPPKGTPIAFSLLSAKLKQFNFMREQNEHASMSPATNDAAARSWCEPGQISSAPFDSSISATAIQTVMVVLCGGQL